MQVSKKYKNPNPKLSANIVSKIFFGWLLPLFWYGRKNHLQEVDLYPVLPENKSEILGKKIESLWNEELINANKNGRKPNFMKVVIIKMFFWTSFYYSLYIAVVTLFLRLMGPILLAGYIKHFENNSITNENNGLIYAIFFSVTLFVQSFTFQNTTLKLRELEMQCNIACSSLIYKKLSKLSSSSETQKKEGLVINLLTDDAGKIGLFLYTMHFLWLTPIFLCEIAYILWDQTGIPGVLAVTLVVLQILPMQIIIGKLAYSLREKVSYRTDRRVLLINEIISGIKLIKLYAWEKPFEKCILLARKLEMQTLSSISILSSINLSLTEINSRTTIFFTITIYILLHKHMMASNLAFSVLEYIKLLQLMMSFQLPRTIKAAAEAKIASKRIQEFLLLEEIENVVHNMPLTDGTISISVEKVNASWNKTSERNTLTHISVQITATKLYTILGPLGAGKSSFLKLILGEIHPTSGKVVTYGKISYADQVPWILNTTVKNNIVFGESFDDKRYKEVIRICCLAKDFEKLPHGDETFLGESDVTLSGGQMARINLARCIYRDADIYLLDDPLSAVDVNVGRALFQDCFMDFLKDKTRVIVSHDTRFLNENDNIIAFNEGQISFQGHLVNLNKDPQFSQFVQAKSEINDFSKVECLKKCDNQVEKIEITSSSNDIETHQFEKAYKTEEIIAKGNIDKSLFLKYLKSCESSTVIFAVIFFSIVSQSFLSVSDYWMSYMVKHHENSTDDSCNSIANQTNLQLINNNDNIECNSQKNNYDMYISLYIYGFLIVGCIITPIARNMAIYKLCLNASRNIHNTMLKCLLGAPLYFFYTNPSGRILNRFSKDTKTVDEMFSMGMVFVFKMIGELSGVAFQVTIANWWIVFLIIAGGYLCSVVFNMYYPAARDITRLEGKTKSSVLSHTNSSLRGLETIRSCQAEAMLQKEFDNLQDHYSSAFYLTIASITAVCLWIDVITCTLTTAVVFSFLLIDNIPAYTVGLVASELLVFCVTTQYLLRQTAEVLMYSVNVERMFQYTKLPAEEPLESEEDKKPPDSWPSKGTVKFHHLHLNYNNCTKSVLKNINFTIQSKEKVGIVGRTGAGKSSLITALFRLAEIEGSLIIDDINIKNIGLHDLRSKISIIPQESILFSKSLRENIDPCNEFDDAAIWSALNDVKLNTAFSSLDELLDNKHFSAGQLQLLSLVRVIIKKNKILVLDEATANVDQETDTLVQEIIRSKFKDCTVLTIAHRLNTIIDSDKIIVMDSGEVVEFAHPYLLLQKESGYFNNLLKSSGEATYRHLKEIAKDAWMKKESAENNTESASTKL